MSDRMSWCPWPPAWPLWLLLPALAACGEPDWREMTVTASAYNAVPGQTTAVDPDLAAWGDRLEPGMQVIAVSRDLLREGLVRGSQVRIEGLPGTWVVMDKMHARWRRKIDLFMGDDRRAVREWGIREVAIRWRPPPES
ncbi:hypothetical protein [Algiphilus sp.]|uniref:3D domain-containing protein n=1 Tax=Algiphilus sp. TaxID=1872431 RepID=UPI0025C5CA8A|nr:hypothetical protein [Algiphilus sp.]MCK5768950.1 3D domain-containing protein [Algiphilus sp.]